MPAARVGKVLEMSDDNFEALKKVRQAQTAYLGGQLMSRNAVYGTGLKRLMKIRSVNGQQKVDRSGRFRTL